ncbi:putative bifunctional diguanylate cyclase/phosphodiesterase [Agrobacterium vitis]
MALHGSGTAAVYNVMAGLSTSILLLAEANNVSVVVGWMTALAVATLFRFLLSRHLLHRHYASSNPDDVLRLMCITACLQGTVWALLPTAVVDMDLLGRDASILVVIGGLVATAMFRQAGTSQVAFSYCIPMILAILWNFAIHGGIIATVSTFNFIVLAIFMSHLLLKADRTFMESEMAKLSSQAATQSLTIANEDIHHKNLRLEVLANGDPVTGLFNRIYFNGRLAGEIAAAKVGNREIGLLLVNVDRFKLINDAFGHRGGDQFLAILGQRLKNAAGGDAITARISGDEFAILLRNGDVRQDCRALAETVIAASMVPIAVHGTQVSPGLSAGIAFFPDHAENGDGLFTCASMALSDAKQDGRGQLREFDHQIKQRIDRQRRIEQDLPAALRDTALETWFQPQVDLATGKIVGFEALVRWFHPEFGAIAPPEIVNAAQAMQMCEALTGFVTENICQLLNRLKELGMPETAVALNVSPREFALYDVSVMLDRITTAYGVSRNLLEVEITEETILDPAVAGEQLTRLENSGYKLTVDDFGMGYSSLAYLISLKITRLKIDRSFVTGISNSPKNKALVVALVGLGRALGVDIVAEGVETVADARTLTEIGCTIGQGYYFSRPMPADMLPKWLDFKKKQLSEKKSRRAVA